MGNQEVLFAFKQEKISGLSMKALIFTLFIPVAFGKISQLTREIIEVQNFVNSLSQKDLEAIRSRLQNEDNKGYYKLYIPWFTYTKKFLARTMIYYKYKNKNK